MRTRTFSALSLALAVAAGACSDNPTKPLADAPSPLPTLTGESLAGPEGGAVYHFDDAEGVPLPEDGFPCVAAGEGYLDLTFVEGTSDIVPAGHLQLCRNIFPGGDVQEISLVSFHGAPGIFEDFVVLGSPASSVEVTLATFDPAAGGTIVTAYDEFGVALDVAVSAASEMAASQVLTVSGGGVPIASIGLAAASVTTFFDIVTAFGERVAPVHRDDCKNGGWEGLGFANQGQCVRFVETGEEGPASSRPERPGD